MKASRLAIACLAAFAFVASAAAPALQALPTAKPGTAPSPSPSGAIEEQAAAGADPRIAGRIGGIFSELPSLTHVTVRVQQGVVTLGGTVKAGHVILSLALFPRWASLFFFKGPLLEDPAGLLEGSGSTVRHVKIRRAEDFRRAEIDALIAQALQLAQPPLDPGHCGRVVIKSISAKQRPRRSAA